MTATLAQQFLALLWKSYKLRRRHPITLGFEIVLPLLLAIFYAVALMMAAKSAASAARASGHTAGFNDDNGLNPATYYPTPSFELTELWFTQFNVRITSQTTVLMYAPLNDETEDLVKRMMKIYNGTTYTIPNGSTYKFVDHPIKVEGYASQESMIEAYRHAKDAKDSYNYKYLSPFTFESTGKKLSYTIRSMRYNNPDPMTNFPFKSNSGPRQSYGDSYSPDRGFSSSDFLSLQTLIDEAYLDYKADQANKQYKKVSVMVGHKAPYPPYYGSIGGWQLTIFVPYVIIFGFLITVPIIVKRVTEEKNNKAREMFRVMGLSDWIYWSTNFLSYLLLYIVQIIIITILVTVKYSGFLAAMPGIDGSLVFFIFLVYGMSFIIFAFLISVPLSRPILGVVLSIIIWVVSFILPYVMLDPLINQNISMVSTRSIRLFACFFPNFALSAIVSIVNQKQIYGYETTWGNMFEPAGIYGDFSVGLVFMIMVSSCFIYGFLIWYLDNIWPWQDGVPKKPWFLFLPSYWIPSLNKKDLIEKVFIDQDPKYFERQVSGITKAIIIKNLQKSFGRKVAVDGISMDIAHGQITCLLGHNGAGKTTTMNMITGMFSPDGGQITIDGFDISKQTREARQSMSHCPQHNVLYGELTVLEHLRLYAAIKGMPWGETQANAVKIANDCQLGHVLNNFPQQLSGGMKRKLCLAVALVGNTKVVILDEPTSGLDPEARRAIWDMLRAVRRERTILLTTHYMEEADALGDTIAIMTQGKISCYGTPMYLKKAFSAGYMLRIAKGLHYNHGLVEALVKQHFPFGSKKSEIDTEVIYTLESTEGETDTAALSPFVKELETSKQKLGIAAFGLSLTTMEDVFLKVGDMAEMAEDEASGKPHYKSITRQHGGDLANNNGSSTSVLTMESSVRPERLTGNALALHRLKALLLKRIHFAKRYWPTVVFQLVLPALIMIGIFAITRAILSPSPPKGRRLDMKDIYGDTYGVFQSNVTTDFYKLYQAQAKANSISVTEIDQTLNMSDYYLDKAKQVSISKYITQYLSGLKVIQETSGSRGYEVWYNYEAAQALPISVNLLSNTRLSELASDSSIEVSSYPVPSDYSSYAILGSTQAVALLWSIMVPLALPFLAASYVLFPIHERASSCKLLQLMTGLHPALFWGASFIYDFITHIVATLLILIIIGCFDHYGIFTTQGISLFAVFILLIFSGFASIPFAYALSGISKKPATGFAIIVIIYIITGIIFTVVQVINKQLVAANQMSKDTFDLCSWIFRISPIFSMSWGLNKILKNGMEPAMCEEVPYEVLNSTCYGDTRTVGYMQDSLLKCCGRISEDFCVGPIKCVEFKDPFTYGESGIGEELLMMFLMLMVSFGLLCLSEFGFANIFYSARKRLTGNQVVIMDPTANTINNGQVVTDSDVIAERYRVDEVMKDPTLIDQEAIVVQDLRRDFGRFVAVRGLSFGVHQQECFGLLGVNGAGKTTTFKMIAGDIDPTFGDARIETLSLIDNLIDFRQQIGYCPQFDALLDKMTGSEMLYLFGRLRGIPEYLLPRMVDELIEMSELRKHAHKKTEAYSGGNKRKLSLAIALIGSPKLILLDEPTSGVDPSARRKIWSTLVKIRNEQGCSIILTSHSMEECEALCSRIAIMVNGNFQCLGPVQHLRAKYGLGYTVIIKLKRALLEARDQVQQAVLRTIPGASLRDSHETMLDFHIADTNVTWSALFDMMEQLKQQHDLEDYSVSDTTLEQIFISFARGQQAQHRK